MNNESQQFIGKIAQKAIIVKDEKVLICRDVADTNLWEIPGGRLHIGETPEEGLAREVREELGVQVEVQKVVYVEQFVHEREGASMPHFLLVYEVKLSDPTKAFVFSPDEVAEVCWIQKDELGQRMLYPNIERALKSYWSL